MFQLSIHKGFSAKIQGCPSSGLEAIDFRRKHGLPEAPSNKIDLPSCAFDNEVRVRELSAAGACIDHNGDWVFGNQSIVECHRHGNGAHSWHGTYYYGGALPVAPEQLKAFVDAPGDDTLFRLAMSICEHNAAEMLVVQQETAAQEEVERRRSQARQLIKDEIDKLESSVKYLKGELKEAKERISELEEQLENQPVS